MSKHGNIISNKCKSNYKIIQWTYTQCNKRKYVAYQTTPLSNEYKHTNNAI